MFVLFAGLERAHDDDDDDDYNELDGSFVRPVINGFTFALSVRANNGDTARCHRVNSRSYVRIAGKSFVAYLVAYLFA